MDERNCLLQSIAKTISTYRQGEIDKPDVAHVDRWARQFAPNNQVGFLREFDHVIKETFFTSDKFLEFINSLVANRKLAGDDPRDYWSKANVLNIQRDGESQTEMVRLFSESLKHRYNLNSECCGSSGGDYIYLDDALFTGGRVTKDLQNWIAHDAPESARVHIIVIASHSSGSHYAFNVRLRDAIKNSGKEIVPKLWCAVELENRRYYRNESDVLWPSEVPDDLNVQAYIKSQSNNALELRVPRNHLGFFSSEEGRQLLEREFLIAGVKIISKIENVNDFHRPLGYGHFNVGLGSLIATYRNCPNNAPLAMWWGDAKAPPGPLHWYPLLPRKTYSSMENLRAKIERLSI